MNAKRALLLTIVLSLVIFGLIIGPAANKATAGVPSDCSGQLTETDIENMADMFASENETDSDWISCSDTISEYNANRLADRLESINYAPTYIPDPSPTPGTNLLDF